ncbi:hypothetical protein [Leifsonia shinshuensis]
MTETSHRQVMPVALAADGYSSGRPIRLCRDGAHLVGVLLLDAGVSLPAAIALEVDGVVGRYRLVGVDAAAALFDWAGEAPDGTEPLRWAAGATAEHPQNG